MVDSNRSCLNREEHFVKGDLFDVFNYQVLISSTHRQKNIAFSSFDGIVTVHDAFCGGKRIHIDYDTLKVCHFKRCTSNKEGIKNSLIIVYSESQKENMKRIVSRHPDLFVKTSIVSWNLN